MQIVYRILFNLFFCLAAPFYLMKLWRRGNWRSGFGQRFARYDNKVKQSVTNSHVIWIHGVSVGEANLAVRLTEALHRRLPGAKMVVSTTTSTGMGELRKKLPAYVLKIYYPIDRHPWVERALMTLHPEAIILVEAEIWPNFLWRARRRSIPVFLVNARLSEKSFRGYRRFGFIFRNLFAGFTGVGTQSEADARRLRDLGCRDEALQVVGSMKFDSPPAAAAHQRLNVRTLLANLGIAPEAPILLGGSTHAGEEKLLGQVFLRLKARHPDLFLVLVPRHFERSREAGRDLESLGLRYLFRSNVTRKSRRQGGSLDCLLVNSTGELPFFYREADIVFVGKSLTAQGGQNPLEPASMGKAVVFGPNMQNFPDIAPALVAREAALQVDGEDSLAAAIERLLEDPALRDRMGASAQKYVQENQGALERTVDMIAGHLQRTEVYVAPGN